MFTNTLLKGLLLAAWFAVGPAFSKPHALQSLTAQRSRSTSTWFDLPAPLIQGAGGQLLWKLILVAIVMLIAGYFILRRQSASAGVAYVMAGAVPTASLNLPVAPGFRMVGCGGVPAASPVSAPGRGVMLMGSLATGAAVGAVGTVGAGMVAGQALMQRMMDGSSALEPPRTSAVGTVQSCPLYDIGRKNFGKAGALSWTNTVALINGGGKWN